MNEELTPGFPSQTFFLEPFIVKAEPEPVKIDLKRMAVIVIDMQNCFASKGGFFDLIGEDISKTQKVIEPISKITNRARSKGVKVAYITMVNSPDLQDIGGPNSPFWYKLVPTSYHEHPEWRDKLTIRGTWGADIVKELRPHEGDILVEKSRYSAFFGTNLDTILKTYDLKYLAFVGIATNICVEASIRDAFHLEYFPILISDATMNQGPPSTKEATIFNVQACHGWVTTTENFLKSLE